MSVKIVETGGVSLTRQLVKTDLSGCLIPHCSICKCDIPGASHNRSGNAYNIKCKLCLEKGIDASYEGETGDNLAWRHKLDNDSVNPTLYGLQDVRVFTGGGISRTLCRMSL